MVLNINGKDVQELIINKNVFIYDDVWRSNELNMESAAIHNAKLGGNTLGPFNEYYAKKIKNGTFQDMWVGDYFTINGHKYTIAGFNYKANHEENTNLKNHLIMLTDVVDHFCMNKTDTAQGGFAGSEMFKDEIPVVEKQLATDFGNHLLTFRSYLSTSIDSSGAPNGGQWFDLKTCLCNAAMWFGPDKARTSNNKNGTKYNWGDESTQLPLMALNPSAQVSGGYIWLRDIAIYDGRFVFPQSSGSPAWGQAHSTNGVQTYFLID